MSARQEIIDTAVPLVGLVFMLGVTTLVFWVRRQWHRSTINAAVRQLGAVPLSIEWSPMFFLFCRTSTHYRVTMRLPSGQVVTSLCQCNVFSGVYWKDTPWLQFQPAPVPPAIPQNASCHQCHYSLQTDWRCCPKCGKAT